jgi:hypothetical protein
MKNYETNPRVTFICNKNVAKRTQGQLSARADTSSLIIVRDRRRTKRLEELYVDDCL